VTGGKGAPDSSYEGLVVACRRRRFAVHQDDGTTIDCMLKGRSATLACGDRVSITRDADGGVIEAVASRTSLVYRSDAFNEKLLAANATQICGVAAPDIGLDEELIHRWIIAAEAEGCRFLLAANKSDLPGFPELMARLAPIATLGYPIVPLSAKDDATPLERWLAGQQTVLIGQSGMGKSTILNAIAPDARAKTADVSESLAAGRHTTSNSTLHLLPAASGGGWIVDSPGLKVFGLAHVVPEALAQAFVEIRPLLGGCRFRDCRHASEPGCAVRKAVATGKVAPHRLALLRELVAASSGTRAPSR
jgi:ribosome biogenesis GTPase / thiamine phosphate phosphatase